MDRGVKEKLRKKKKHIRTRGSRMESRGGAFSYNKGGSFTYERGGKGKKKSKRKAPSCLLDAVSNPISVWPGSAARLPGTGSQWRRGQRRHTSHFKSASSGTVLRARGPHAGGQQCPAKGLNSSEEGGGKKRKNYLSVSRIGLTSKSENESSFRSLHVDMDG